MNSPVRASSNSATVAAPVAVMAAASSVVRRLPVRVMRVASTCTSGSTTVVSSVVCAAAGRAKAGSASRISRERKRIKKPRPHCEIRAAAPANQDVIHRLLQPHALVGEAVETGQVKHATDLSSRRCVGVIACGRSPGSPCITLVTRWSAFPSVAPQSSAVAGHVIVINMWSL